MQTNKYLVVSERDLKWGLNVDTIGYEEIAPGEKYPTGEHADGYFFDTSKGRVLNEYQLLYVTEGEGVFESEHIKKRQIKNGELFLLFPNEWHNYMPNPAIGWKCYWIGFRGKNIDDRVRAGFLSVEKPVFHAGFNDEIVRLYKSAQKAAIDETDFSQQLLSGIVNHLIGLTLNLERNIILNKDQSRVNMINRARLRIREALESDLTIQQIASEQGMSYSNFRKLFKEHTGISPALYQQDLKLQRAKELLSTTNMSVKEIAYQLHFDSPDYFSSKFKAKTGMTPSVFRPEKR